VVPAPAKPYIGIMMTLAIHEHRLAKPGSQDAALRDYDSVRRASLSSPRTGARSDHRGHRRCVRADAGRTAPSIPPLGRVTPKAFMQALTLDHAKSLLREEATSSTLRWSPACQGRAGCTICS